MYHAGDDDLVFKSLKDAENMEKAYDHRVQRKYINHKGSR